MKPQREKSRDVSLSLRFKEEMRAEVESTARERGISMNDEIVERIRGGSIILRLSEGQFTLTDFRYFQEYASCVKLAVRAAGEDPETWLSYAHLVPFPGNSKTAFEDAKKAIASAIDTELKQDRDFIREYLAKHGVPPDRAAPRRRAASDLPGELTPAAEYYSHAERIARVAANRRKVDG